MTSADWKKQHQKIVDQRDTLMPPTWISLDNTKKLRRPATASVHISTRSNTLDNRVCELLEQAEQIIVVSTFLLASPKVEQTLIDAADRGVRVYVMLASEARLGQAETDDDFGLEVLEYHKEMLKRLVGRVLLRSAPQYHAKVVVIDPETAPRGILLTANLTRKALTRNEELAVDLTPSEVNDVWAILRWAMWELAEHELIDASRRFAAVKPINSIEPPRVDLPVTTPSHDTLRKQALTIIDSANSRLIVASFGWGFEHPVIHRLVERVEEGLEVVVLARIRPSVMPALLRLAKAGANVYGFQYLHAKAIWSDSNQALVMSANLESYGLDTGFELGVYLQGSRAVQLEKNLTHWCAKALWRLECQPALGNVNGHARLWVKNKLEDIEIHKSIEVDLGEQTASSADELIIEMPALETTGVLPHPAHEVVCTWTVSAPILQKNAKPKADMANTKPIAKKAVKGKLHDQPVLPAAYSQGKQTVIAVENPSQLPAAIHMKSKLSADSIVVRTSSKL